MEAVKDFEFYSKTNHLLVIDCGGRALALQVG